ncbi:MAG: helix-turn-helix transcriptional regulator [Candidatus Pacebacteria bacterium]|nr:helix-turn-helix transcriptional regulator [Candidatus Paceibacterota bacterium]
MTVSRGNIKTVLKGIRSESSVTQEQLADAVGVSRQTIISIEKGNYTPSVLLALRIAMHFDTPVEKIFIYEK